LGIAIYIDFNFLANKTRIISTYLPSSTNHSNLNKHTQEKIFFWFLEAKHRNWNSILLGDLNANQFRDKKFPLFNKLNSANAISLLSFYNITTPTWKGPNSTSQI